MSRRSILKIGLIVFVTSKAVAADIDFDRDVRPILSDHCFQCHGPDEKTREAGLRLDTRPGLFGVNAEKKSVVVPGDLSKSELYSRIISTDDLIKMPPKEGKSLSVEQIATLRRWIEQGAAWRGHWSFESIRRPQVPTMAADRPDNPVDAFLVNRWNASGFVPVNEADEHTLRRRLSFDLTGLPPDLNAEDARLNDGDSVKSESYLHMVDRLLASPHFGERLAVYWLDLVRYADSCGYHSDVDQQISPYRDYVISAFNRNLPFDQFTREQIAGDLLPEPTIEQRIATGFNRLNKSTEEGGAQEEEYLAKALADRVRTVSGTWLGVTFGCAECHDHKYDPITTRDFYRLGAFFADVKERGVYSGNGRHEPELVLATPTQQRRLDELKLDLSRLQTKLESVRSSEPSLADEIEKNIKALEQQIKEFEKMIPRTMVTVAVAPRTIRILPRGDWLNRNGETVDSAVPAFFQSQTSTHKSQSRLDLADWLVDRKNPLTARVFVNRLWKLFFGVGFSKNLDDLGAQGEVPSQPELLDWLAAEFIDSGWDIKYLIRLIVSSRAYRLSSVPTPELVQRDPHNRMFARQSRWRLDAEFLRDNALSVSGLLSDRIGGPSVKPYQPEGYWEFLNFPKRTWQASQGNDQYRRGVYTHWQRTFLHPAMLAFDAPSREECTANRPTSNTPKSALALLNDPSLVEAARAFATRILQAGANTDQQRLEWAWHAAMTRSVQRRELDLLTELLASNRLHYRSTPRDAEFVARIGQSQVPSTVDVMELASWTAVTRAIMNLHEFTSRN